MRKFTIRASGRIGPRRHVLVRIHPDLQSLRAAAHALSPQHDGLAHWDNSWACFHPAQHSEHSETLTISFPANGYAGTLRLTDRDAEVGDEGPLPFEEIVAHELVHATAMIYRMNVAKVINLGGGRPGAAHEHEEQFAYIYGELAADMRAKLD